MTPVSRKIERLFLAKAKFLIKLIVDLIIDQEYIIGSSKLTIGKRPLTFRTISCASCAYECRHVRCLNAHIDGSKISSLF
jgi:hypothetical protein